MNAAVLLEESLARIMKAVALQRPDRVPVVLEYASFAARVTNTPLPDFLLNLRKSVEVMIEAYKLVTQVGQADAINYGRFSPYGLCYLWLSKVKVPGVDLPVDASHQVLEKELMTRNDYDLVLREGWPKFYRAFMKEKVLDDVPPAVLPSNQPTVDSKEAWAKLGVPVLSNMTIGPPFELLCGGRSLACFAMDLLEIPDKIEAVMEEILPHLFAPFGQKARTGAYPAVWIGGWRTAPALLSPEMWNRFVWPYLRRLVYEVLEHKLIPLLHLDSNWDRELERFRELPRGKIIMALDGETDIFRAKEILGDHICLMGDVPASMLFREDPDTVYNYSTRLIRELGPKGFILHSGCDIPENAKLENVRAMVAAAVES